MELDLVLLILIIALAVVSFRHWLNLRDINEMNDDLTKWMKLQEEINRVTASAFEKYFQKHKNK